MLFVGRFVYQKNIPFLLRAFAKAAQGRDMTLVLIGDGEERHTILSVTAELGINEKVSLVQPPTPLNITRRLTFSVCPPATKVSGWPR